MVCQEVPCLQQESSLYDPQCGALSCDMAVGRLAIMDVCYCSVEEEPDFC